LHVLPAKQEAHEVGRRDRLQLGAKSNETAAMNARQKFALAPFDGVATRRE